MKVVIMARKSERASLVLTQEQLATLQELSASRVASAREVERAKVMLGYADGFSITELQRRLGFSRPMIYRCVDKALAAGVHMGLKDKYHRQTKWAAQRIHGSERRQVEAVFQEEKPHLLALPMLSMQYFTERQYTVNDDSCVRLQYLGVPRCSLQVHIASAKFRLKSVRLHKTGLSSYDYPRCRSGFMPFSSVAIWMASIKLEASARPVPAISKAVP